MRGPLTSARLAIGQLSKLNDSPTNSGSVALEVLQDETRRLEQLAQEFSDFGRLPEGPDALIDVSELLETVVASSTPDSAKVETAVEAGLSINGHFEPLRRAVQNLIRNALDASGSARVDISASRFHDDSVEGIRIEISDNGPGIPQEMRDKIFEPYFTTKELGTGLGLAIVRQTIVAHGGEVVVADAAGGGARFIITLPEK
jgi:two-component system NtrC family sensor kinase